MSQSITWWAIAGAVGSFLLAAFSVILPALHPETKAIDAVKQAASQALTELVGADLDQAAKFIEALGKAIDAVAKAGPALGALIVSVLFLFVATLNDSGYLSRLPQCSTATPGTVPRSAQTPPQSEISDQQLTNVKPETPRSNLPASNPVPKK